MSARTFVVTISESPARVVVEDVRSGDRRAVPAGLPELGREIARLLAAAPDDASRPAPTGGNHA